VLEQHPPGSRSAPIRWVVSDNVHLLDVVFASRRNGAKLIAVVVLAHNVQRQESGIVDGAALRSLRDSRQHMVEVRVELAVDLDQRVFLRRANQKAHDHQALAGLEVEYTYSTPEIWCTSVSMGSVTRSSTSAGDAPGIAVVMFQHGNQDLRLLSRGIIAMENAPRAATPR